MIVLIDDDLLICKGWAYKASKLGFDFHFFQTVEAFIEVAEKYPKECKIYIDSHLSGEVKGELRSKDLFNMGFQNLYLVTGFRDLNKNDYPWLKDILDKKCPF